MNPFILSIIQNDGGMCSSFQQRSPRYSLYAYQGPSQRKFFHAERHGAILAIHGAVRGAVSNELLAARCGAK